MGKNMEHEMGALAYVWDSSMVRLGRYSTKHYCYVGIAARTKKLQAIP